MKRAFNFGPGPSALPLEVLQQAAAELVELGSTGMSIAEVSHRGADYEALHNEAQALTKELLGVGDDYRVLLLPGGASLQFVMVPMNLRPAGATADYLVSGSWAKKAYKEAKVLGTTNLAADTAKDGQYTRVPRADECRFSDNAAYVHLTSNNTIVGTQYHAFPTAQAPLVADMSSDFMSRPLDAQRFALIYAGAQKNIGPAGVAVVVMREELLARCNTGLPSMLSYTVHAENNSLYNTPPCLTIYMVGKTLKWIKANGGLQGMAERNQRKAALIYGVIDELADFYRAPVERDSRSLMNVVFRLPDEALEKRFVSEAKQANFIGVKGHRSVGGMRVSLYNGVEPAWVEALAAFMRDFVRKNG